MKKKRYQCNNNNNNNNNNKFIAGIFTFSGMLRCLWGQEFPTFRIIVVRNFASKQQKSTQAYAIHSVQCACISVTFLTSEANQIAKEPIQSLHIPGRKTWRNIKFAIIYVGLFTNQHISPLCYAGPEKFHCLGKESKSDVFRIRWGLVLGNLNYRCCQNRGSLSSGGIPKQHPKAAPMIR